MMNQESNRGTSKLFRKLVGSADSVPTKKDVTPSPVTQQKQVDISFPWTFVKGSR